MNIQIGDTVRFLSEKMEGKVTQIIDRNTVQVYVQEFGFEIPASLNDLVVIHSDIARTQASDKIQATTPISVKPADNVFLAIVPDNFNNLAASRYEFFLVNDTLQTCLYSAAFRNGEKYTGIAAGNCPPDSTVSIGQYTMKDIMDHIHAARIQAIFFQKGNTVPKTPVEAEIKINSVSLCKAGAYSRTRWFSQVALLRPLDKKDAAEQFHQRFNDEKSDFISILKLYEYVSSLQKTLSNSALRRQLKHEFISYLRVREWFDLHRQLKAACQGLQLEGNQLPADYEALHRSLLSGLLSQIGQQELSGHEYKGARGVKFLIFPGSALAKKPPKWLCAAALVETSRLFARTVAAIDPCWLEWQGAHLIKKSYADPHWSKKSGAVLASLTISLYGLAVVQGRQVQYGTVDPALCHELMIKEGLVGGEINCRHAFYQHNQHLIAQVEHLEDQVRRRDLLAEPEDLERFYQERIPGHIINQRQLDKWWQEQRKKDPHYLDFKLEDVLKQEAAADHAVLYPEYWQQGSLKLKLSYVFNPGDPKDGVSVHIPLTVINQVKADDFVYQIPGLRLEFLSVLIRSLPKRLRRNLIPAPDYARALLQSLQLFKGNLYQQAARELTRMGGEIVSPEDFDLSSIDRHLFISFIIEDLQGKELACGKNLGVLAQSLAGQARSALQQIVKSHQSSKAPVSAWTFGEIKKERITKQGSLSINAYPALTDKGSGVALELYDSKERQARAMWLGQRRLIFLNLKNPLSFLEAHLPNKAKLAMYYQPLGSVQELVNDMMLHAINELMVRHGAPVWNEIDFRQLFDKVRANLHDAVLETAQIVEQILREAHELKRRLKGRIGLEEARAYADVGAQLDALVYKGFVSACSKEHLGDIPRYLQAALLRLDKLSREVNRDLNCLRKLEKVSDCWQGALTRYPKDDAPQPLLDVKWMIEELRVSYFAQTLGVKGPISDKRILQEINRVLADYPPLH